jgi:hypothetical protein
MMTKYLHIKRQLELTERFTTIRLLRLGRRILAYLPLDVVSIDGMTSSD